MALADRMGPKPEVGLQASEGEMVKPLPAAVMANLVCDEGLMRFVSWWEIGRGLALCLEMGSLFANAVSGKIGTESPPRRWKI